MKKKLIKVRSSLCSTSYIRLQMNGLMEKEVSIRQKRSRKKGDAAVQRQDVTETDSSFFRQLEKEDLQRFAVINEEDEEGEKKKHSQKRIAKAGLEEELSRNNKSTEEAGKGRFGKKEGLRPKRNKIGRFLQKRMNNKVNKRWHSDSELLESMSKEEASLASRKNGVKKKAKGDERQGAARSHDQNAQKKISQVLQDVKKECHHGRSLHCDGVLGGQFDRKEGCKKEDKNAVRKWMNSSFPISVQDEEVRNRSSEHEPMCSGDSRVLNLLIEYFKDLNKEVREFRDEKKKAREQIQGIEIRMEKFLAKLEAQEFMLQLQIGKEAKDDTKREDEVKKEDDAKREGNGMKRKDTKREDEMKREGDTKREDDTKRKDTEREGDNARDSSNDGSEIDSEKEKRSRQNQESKSVDSAARVRIEDRADIKLEIRNILADVHSKYKKQLVEHEIRMKCVQEKAEMDIQNLMKTIVGKYVELSNLRGTEKEISKLVNRRGDELVNANDSPEIAMDGRMKCDERSKGMFYQERGYLEVGARQGYAGEEPAIKEAKATSSSNKFTSDDVNRYKFYFPRESRGECKAKERMVKDRSDEAEFKVGTSQRGNDNEAKESNAALLRTGGKNEDERNLRELANPSPPEGLGASYLEWKKHLFAKLQKRNALSRGKKDKKGQEGKPTSETKEASKETSRNNT